MNNSVLVQIIHKNLLELSTSAKHGSKDLHLKDLKVIHMSRYALEFPYLRLTFQH